VVDLHVHSNASDGEHPPGEVVRRAAAAGLTTLALSDHDTVAGVREARRAGDALAVRVIAACEFSVRADWGEMHLLAYFLPVDAPVLERMLATQRANRTARMEEIVRRLAALGIAVTMEAVHREAAGGALGRPHAARALVRGRVVGDVNEAFNRYLGGGKPAFVEKVLPEVESVTELVRRVGGITSAAHLKDRAGRRALERLQQQGVDAVEVVHPSHTDQTRQRIAGVAAELGLLRTGGSDWHGTTHERDPGRVPLGDITVPATWLDALDELHRVREPAEAAG